MKTRQRQIQVPNSALALDRLKAVWSLTSILMHALLIIALLKPVNKQLPPPLHLPWKFEFIEISLQDLPPKKNSNIKEIANTEKIIANNDDAVVIKSKDNQHQANLLPVKNQPIDRSYEARLSRHVYKYLQQITFEKNNHLRIWLRLDRNGIIREHGLLATHLNSKLRSQITQALRNSQPLPKPPIFRNDEVITYVIPIDLAS
jgi:hypothetical protein